MSAANPIHPKVAVPSAVAGVLTVALAIAQVVANSKAFPALVPIASAVLTVLVALSGYLTPGPAPKVPQVALDVLTLLQQLGSKLDERPDVKPASVSTGTAQTAAEERLAPGATDVPMPPSLAALFPAKDDGPKHAAWTPAAVGNPDAQ